MSNVAQLRKYLFGAQKPNLSATWPFHLYSCFMLRLNPASWRYWTRWYLSSGDQSMGSLPEQSI